jgi:hypothetical protein
MITLLEQDVHLVVTRETRIRTAKLTMRWWTDGLTNLDQEGLSAATSIVPRAPGN